MEDTVASRIWDQTPEESKSNPYAHDEHRAFLDEAKAILTGLLEVYQTRDMTYLVQETSREKAVWMLQYDALDALLEAEALLRENRHTIAARLFRDVSETLDMAAYFAADVERSRNYLQKWYKNEIISHSRYRDYVEQARDSEAKGRVRAQYRFLSKFTHRTYDVISQGYGVGTVERIWSDRRLRDFSQAIPQAVAEYLPILAALIRRLIIEAHDRGAVDKLAVRRVLRAWVTQLNVGADDEGSA
jgi:hypothetical protein